jgi:hypothetical protein
MGQKPQKGMYVEKFVFYLYFEMLNAAESTLEDLECLANPISICCFDYRVSVKRLFYVLVRGDACIVHI